MTRNRVLIVLGLACVLAAGLSTVNLGRTSPPDLQTVLGSDPFPMHKRLYSGKLDGKTGQPLTDKDSSVESDSPHVRYFKLKDNSSEDQELVPNSQHLISSRSYFPPVTAQPGRRLHIARSFRAKGNFDEVVAEEIRRLDGTMAKQTNLLDDGRKHIVDYADDGITFVGEKWFAKPDCCMDPVLQSDMRWFADAKHTVAHANVLNGDGTHTITDFDISEHVLRLEQQPQYGSVPGTTIEAYYLGSYKLRYRAKCDYSSDHVEYLREDGTLSYTLSMSYGLVTIKYFDNTGKKQVLEQTWYRNTDTTDGVTKHTYVLSDVTLTDAEGNKTRMLTVNHEGRAYHEELYDATINGVKYKEVDNFYSPDGTLSESRFWNTSVDHPYDKSEPHTAAENLRVTVPVGVLAMRVQIDEDLPVPYPQRGEGGM